MKTLKLLWTVAVLIFFVSTMAAQEPEFAWAQKTDVYSGRDFGFRSATDPGGNSVLLGAFNGRIKYMDGSDSFNLESGDFYTPLLVKWNVQNELLWALYFLGNSFSSAQALAIDVQGNIFVGGCFEATFDADPGPGVANLISMGLSDVFIVKFDSSGHFLWARSTGGTGYDFISDLAIDAEGNLGAVGYFNAVVDFDPGAGMDVVQAEGVDDAFVWKLDGDGNHRWVWEILSDDVAYGYATAFDGAGNLFAAGHFSGTADFDPGPGSLPFSAMHYPYDLYLQKLSPEGNLLWAHTYGQGRLADLVTDSAGQVYTTGTYEIAADFDPGPGDATLTSFGNTDVFIHKLDADGNFVWARGFGGVYHETAGGLALDVSGNVYTTGGFRSVVDFNPGPATLNVVSQGYSDVFVQKLNPDGQFAWVKIMGGPSEETGSNVSINPAGELLVTGSFYDTIDLDPGSAIQHFASRGYSDLFLQKMTGSGDYLWATTSGGNGGAKYSTDIVTDNSKKTVTCGYFSGEIDADPGAGYVPMIARSGSDIYIQKFDQEGGFMWMLSLGGVWSDAAFTVTTDASDNILVAGYFADVVDFDPGSGVHLAGVAGKESWFVLKLDPDGCFVWVKIMLGSTAGTMKGNPEDIKTDAAGNIYLAGSFANSFDFDPNSGVQGYNVNGLANCVVLKLDSLGNFLWAHNTGGEGFDAGTSLATDKLGNVYVAGVFSQMVDFDPGAGTALYDAGLYSDCFIEKFDAEGDYQWVRVISGDDFFNPMPQIHIDNNRSLYLAGGFSGTLDADPGPDTHLLQSDGAMDALLLRMDLDGTFESALRIGGLEHDAITSVYMDGDNNLYASGFFGGYVDFDPSDTNEFLLYAASYDAFVLKFNKNGMFQWVGKFSSEYIDAYSKVTLDRNNDILSIGNFINTVDCDPGPDVYPMHTATTNTYLIKLSQASSGVSAPTAGRQLSAWPNPTTGPLSIDLDEQPLDVEVSVNSLEGKLLKRQYFENVQTLDVPLDGLMPGVYFVQVRGEGILATVRVVKN